MPEALPPSKGRCCAAGGATKERGEKLCSDRD